MWVKNMNSGGEERVFDIFYVDEEYEFGEQKFLG